MLQADSSHTSGSKAAAREGDTAPDNSRRVIVVSLTILATAALIWLLSWAKGLLIPLSFAAFLAISLRPVVSLLARMHVPRAIGAALLLVALSAGVGLLVNYSRDDAVRLLDQMPSAARYLRREVNSALNNPGSLAHRLKTLVELPNGAPAGSDANANLPNVTVGMPAAFEEGTRQFFSAASELGVVLFLVYLMLASSGQLQRRLASSETLSPELRRASQLAFAQVERSLHHYLAVLVATNALLGLAVWGTFALFGVHYALAWGLAAAVTHFVPYVGPAMIAVGSAVFASVQFDSIPRGLVIAATTLAFSSIIGVGLQTWWSGRSTRMNTVAVFVSLVFWSWIWGLPGLVLGTPLTLVFKAVCAHIRWLGWVDALLDTRHGERRHAKDKAASLRRTALRTVERVLPS